MLANLDGICEHPDYGTVIFEAKTASAYKSGEWDDAIPDEYLLQVECVRKGRVTPAHGTVEIPP